MLNEAGATYTYRDYTKSPLDEAELVALFEKLGQRPADLLRSRDAKKVGLTGSEDDAVLIEAMAGNNRLLQRPILVVGDRAVVGRPVENLHELL